MLTACALRNPRAARPAAWRSGVVARIELALPRVAYIKAMLRHSMRMLLCSLASAAGGTGGTGTGDGVVSPSRPGGVMAENDDIPRLVVGIQPNSSRGLPLLGFGNEIVLQDVDDAALAAAAAAAGGRALRYPGGAPSNSWDWRLGCCTVIAPNETAPTCGRHAWNDNDGYGHAVPASWARYVQRSSVGGEQPVTIFDLNVVESNVSFQLEGLRALAKAGVKIEMLELGNELYDGQQNLGRWSDGAGYAKAMKPFLAALTAAFPEAKTAVVGSGWWPGMDSGWQSAVLENTTATAATFHFYTSLDTHGISEATVAERAPVLLSEAFATAEHIHADAERTIPSQLRIWITEFGHYGSYAQGQWATTEIDGTWLEGLYSGAALVLALRTSRVDVVMPYCLVCADQNAPSFTSGSPWGSLVPANESDKVQWSLTPRGAVLSAVMQAVAKARAASTTHGIPVTMQELTFTAPAPTRSVSATDGGSCGAAGIGAGGYCIHYEKTKTACACQTLCTQYKQCRAWQFIASAKAKDYTSCYLKSTVQLSPEPASVSGACERHNGSVCLPPLPPPLNRTWAGWAFTQSEKVTSAVLLHLGGNSTVIDLSGVLTAAGSTWRVTTQHQPGGAASLLRNMSTAVTDVVTTSDTRAVVAHAYSVLTLEAI